MICFNDDTVDLLTKVMLEVRTKESDAREFLSE